MGPLLRHEPALLDISTNLSHIGVSFTGETPLTVKDMTAFLGASNLKVFCLPSVQWEAVYMANPDDTHQTLSYPSTGIATKMATDSVTLIPINPRQAVDEAISAYESFMSSQAVSVNLQLPFGMVAQAKAAKPLLPGQIRDSNRVQLVQPLFEKESSIRVDQPRNTQSARTGADNRVFLTGATQVAFRSPVSDDTRGLSWSCLDPVPRAIPAPTIYDETVQPRV